MRGILLLYKLLGDEEKYEQKLLYLMYNDECLYF